MSCMSLIIPIPKRGSTNSTILSEIVVTGASAAFIGDGKTCKTSLLFQAAVSHATDGEKVIYMCPERFKSLPLHIHGMPHARHATSQHIKFIYISNCKDLFLFLSRIHLEKILPGMILVDELHFYVNQMDNGNARDFVIAKLLAALKDAVDFCSSKRSSPCYLLLAMQQQDSFETSTVVKQFIQSTWHICNQALESKFQMSNKQSPTEFILSFYVEKKELFLDTIEES